MKNPPDIQKLEAILRSSKLVANGFMGDDPRGVMEIIEADVSTLSKLGYTTEQVARRMQEITNMAIPHLGNWVRIDPQRQVRVDEAKGLLVCPWPHAGRFAKRVTIVRLIDSGRSIHWSDLNIHLIEKHGFFEGTNSAFRLEPKELVKIIFDER